MTQLLVSLNKIANAVASLVLAPVALLPGWLSATTIGIATGLLMLLAFKYTSHQAAIKRTRNQIKANLLALSLFKDNVFVGLRAQGRLLANAAQLLGLALVPMAVMTLPMILLLGQMSLWYQARPLKVDEQAVITVRLSPDALEKLNRVQLREPPSIEVSAGPVRVPSKNMICWNIAARKPGMHDVQLQVDDQTFAKQLPVGDGFMPTSLKRPAWQWSEVLLHPREEPFAKDSVVQSIEVAFPERPSLAAGTGSWLVYWFFISMLAAFAAKPLFNVNI